MKEIERRFPKTTRMQCAFMLTATPCQIESIHTDCSGGKRNTAASVAAVFGRGQNCLS
jgi:hypothetical protein